MNVESPHREVVERVQQEHDLLRERLAYLQRVFATKRRPADEAAALLWDLWSVLRVHFAHEESEGFFTEVTTYAPRLTCRADNLCFEHEAMLHTVSDLARFSRAGAASQAWWRELTTRFQALCTQLARHERDEHRLLQDAYQVDLGGDD